MHCQPSMTLPPCRPRCHHADCRCERPSQVPPRGGAVCSELPGPGLWDCHTLLSAPGSSSRERLAWRSGWHTQDHPGLPSGGKVRHAGWQCVHAQTGPEWNGDAEGQPCVGIRKYHTGGQLHHRYSYHSETVCSYRSLQNIHHKILSC